MCVIPATLVPCKWLFLAGAEIATDHQSCLGPDKFKQLQILKHTWQNHIVDAISMNLGDTAEIYLNEFQELLQRDQELSDWDDNGEVVDLYIRVV